MQGIPSCFLRLFHGIFHLPNELTERNAQGVGNAPKGVHIGVLPASFNHGQVTACNASQPGKHFLGKIPLHSQLADDASRNFAVVIHATSPFLMQTIAFREGLVYYAKAACDLEGTLFK